MIKLFQMKMISKNLDAFHSRVYSLSLYQEKVLHNKKLYTKFKFLICFGHTAQQTILIPQPGTEPRLLAVGAESNHRTGKSPTEFKSTF